MLPECVTTELCIFQGIRCWLQDFRLSHSESLDTNLFTLLRYLTSCWALSSTQCHIARCVSLLCLISTREKINVLETNLHILSLVLIWKMLCDTATVYSVDTLLMWWGLLVVPHLTVRERQIVCGVYAKRLCSCECVTYWFGLDFFGIEGLEELGVTLQFQALLCYSEVAHAVLQGTKTPLVHREISAGHNFNMQTSWSLYS